MRNIENHWIAEQARENDRRGAEDDALEECARRLYFEALRELSVSGKLRDDEMQYQLDDAIFAGHDGGLDPTKILQLVGDVHRVASLDLPGRQRALARLGAYFSDLVEKHLNPLIDAQAAREFSA